MKKETKEKRLYKTPECRVIEMDQEQFICTTVLPNPPGSTEEEWGNEEGVNGGEGEI